MPCGAPGAFPRGKARRAALRKLIVTADDFGLSAEVNEADELAHRKGISAPRA